MVMVATVMVLLVVIHVLVCLAVTHVTVADLQMVVSRSRFLSRLLSRLQPRCRPASDYPACATSADAPGRNAYESRLITP